MSLDQTQQPQGLGGSFPLSARPLLAALEQIERGQLSVTLPGGQRYTFTGASAGPVASLDIKHPLRLVARVVLRGSLGFAEGYVAGDWDAPEPGHGLEDTLYLLSLNECAIARIKHMAEGKMSARIFDRLQHWLRPNTRTGSRRNIAFHYDLGNDFYRLWLDPSMTYSAALFDAFDEPLIEAQRRKYARILDQLDARPGQHILEIGCGWGGLALAAAQRGLRVTGLSLSREQLNYARARVREAGLEDRIELRLQDYRDLNQRFDHIVSIEMFEAVGEAYWPVYIKTLRNCLKPGGRAALQVITIAEERFEYYRRNTDFIQKYIFPGGMLPSVEVFGQLAGAGRLRIVDRLMFGKHYAHTLRRWHERLLEARGQLRAMNYDQRFLRLWRYYLAYCAAGFHSNRIDVMHVTLAHAQDA